MSDTLNSKVAAWDGLVAIAHQIVHGGSDLSVMTEGGAVRSFAKLMADKDAEINNRYDGAIEQAESSAETATAARIRAELARDVAAQFSGIYASAPAGITATNALTSKYFSVPSPDSAEYLILYFNNAGVAVEQKRYPSAASIANLQAVIRDEYTELYAYTVRDPWGRVAFGIKNDGTVAVLDLTLATLNGLTTDGIMGAITTAQGLAQVAADKTAAFTTLTGVAPAYTINDAVGRTAFEIATDGTISIAALKVAAINGGNALTLRPSYGGTFDGEKVYFNNTGQSLASGRIGAITKTQEYDNIGFANGVDNPGTPTAYYPLTSANCSQLGNTEPPLFGALGYIKALIERENGIDYTQQKYQLLGADNSHGSYALSALNKGSALYSASMLQAAAAKSIAAAENQTFVVGSVFWTQGEADAANGYAYYLGALKTLATNFDADYKAISGQTRNIPFITYQVGSTTGNRDVARAQLQASIDLPNLIYISTPMYQFDYEADGVHINGDSTKWYGGYQGLVHKRLVVDKLPWTATRPISAVVSGKFANVRFAMNAKPLMLDAVLVPQQVNYGFTLVDSAGVDLPIASVSVVGPEHVKVVAVSAIPAGAKLRYGYNTAVGKGGFVGGCGNLRDSMGDAVPLHHNRPLHGWAVISEFQLS